MTEQELEEQEKRITAARRLVSNIQQTARHLETLGTLVSDSGEVDAGDFKTVVRGMEVIFRGAAHRIQTAIIQEVASILTELRAEFEKV